MVVDGIRERWPGAALGGADAAPARRTDGIEIIGVDLAPPLRAGALPHAQQGMLEDRQFVVAA
jgi:hypothetical protein